ncbi:hypothetical protein E6C27_scaffold2484G00020 [Cucumis melo var. makuwa]|uniref:Uncharacterized protein n=1 Tax=Cucumis melo var. makuwa TaxID=1194695 RepID=A0A5A7VRL9_CUCMM|nr:hypothetical protein E6C27_scaffold2484G00020 [Cucumis melo var. makuwa]
MTFTSFKPMNTLLMSSLYGSPTSQTILLKDSFEASWEVDHLLYKEKKKQRKREGGGPNPNPSRRHAATTVDCSPRTTELQLSRADLSRVSKSITWSLATSSALIRRLPERFCQLPLRVQPCHPATPSPIERRSSKSVKPALPSRSLSYTVAHRAPSIEACKAQPRPRLRNPSRTHVPNLNSRALVFDPELDLHARIFFIA